jgi:hypothetical protein
LVKLLDPVGLMAARGQLGDEAVCAARLNAARYYEDLFARAAADQSAQERLRQVDGALGFDGTEIVRAILVAKSDVVTLGKARGETDQSSIRYFGLRFRECLDCISTVKGSNQQPKAHARGSDQAAAERTPQSYKAIQASRDAGRRRRRKSITLPTFRAE